MRHMLSVGLVLAVLQTGCAPSEPPKAYANEHFSFSYPGTYEVSRESPFGDVIFERKVDKRRSRLYVRSMKAKEVERRYSKTKAEYQGGKGKLVEDAPLKVGGASGYRLAIADEGKQNVYELTVLAQHQDEGVHIKFTYPDAKPPADLLSDIDRMLDSWRWKQAAAQTSSK